MRIKINGNDSNHNKTGMNAKQGRGDAGRKEAVLILLDEHGQTSSTQMEQ